MKQSFIRIKPSIQTMKYNEGRRQISDAYVRIVLILMFGTAAVSFVMRRQLTPSNKIYAAVFSVLSIMLILEGNRYLWKLIGSHLKWDNNAVKRISAMIFAILCYTILICWCVFQGWRFLFGYESLTVDQTIVIIVIMLFWVLLITHLYETAYLVKQAAHDVVNKEQLERLCVEAELELLKSQIDPHFIFNSLNTLSHLIMVDQLMARRFNDTLADVFRYILLNKGRKLVALKEEVAFLQDYLSLLKIRFNDAIRCTVELDEGFLDRHLIPPISLQILLENAVKHNDFSVEVPLTITVKKNRETIVIENKLMGKVLQKPTSGTGLNNLKERYVLLTGRLPEIIQDNGYFRVTLPILQLT